MLVQLYVVVLVNDDGDDIKYNKPKQKDWATHNKGHSPNDTKTKCVHA